MRDFTLKCYEHYLELLLDSKVPFVRFDEFIGSEEPLERFILARHDVDRQPNAALRMAQLEQRLGVQATYYFRARPRIFVPQVITEIVELGHEIGYHYECLSDANGDADRAMDLFRNELDAFRELAPVRTISMHGSPLKPWDNRDLWRPASQRKTLFRELGILGEVYLDIDYSDIAYINDTGRNWTAGRSNRRDRVDSNVTAEFSNQRELLTYLRSPHDRLVFQIHPERWSNDYAHWLCQYALDSAANTAKLVLGRVLPAPTGNRDALESK